MQQDLPMHLAYLYHQPSKVLRLQMSQHDNHLGKVDAKHGPQGEIPRSRNQKNDPHGE